MVVEPNFVDLRLEELLFGSHHLLEVLIEIGSQYESGDEAIGLPCHSANLIVDQGGGSRAALICHSLDDRKTLPRLKSQHTHWTLSVLVFSNFEIECISKIIHEVDG